MALLDALCDWLGGQPAWQQDLARRLTTSIELDADELAEALGVVYAALGIASDVGPAEPQSFKREYIAAAPDGPAPRLVTFGHLRGVGLVVEDGELTFGRQGLTLIYGQNAAGKSSYVRALKMLCRTVDRGCRVRGNIYTEVHEVPSATLSIEAGGNVTSRRTPLEGKRAERLLGLAVFDSACAELYVDARNTIQYIPSELLLLTRLASTQDRMRKIIDAELAGIRSSAPLLGGFPARTQVMRSLAALSEGSVDVDLEALATLTEEEQSRLGLVRASVAAADASTGRTYALAARTDATSALSLANSLAALARRADAATVQRLRAAADANRTAEEAVRLAGQEFASGPVGGIGSHAWRVLWNAAREFITGEGGAFPPIAGEPCPLCLQRLGDEAADSLAHFERHVTSAVQGQANEASAALAGALAACDPAHAAACRTDFLAGLQAREPGLAAQVDHVIGAITDHLRLITANPLAATPLADIHSEAITALTTWAQARTGDADRLGADNPGQLAKMRQELAELKARQILGRRLDEFRAWQERLRRAAALDRARTALATNKITTKQRQLADRHLSTRLKEALAKELTHLKCTHLPVGIEMQTARARTTVGLRLLSSQVADLSDVASEGERQSRGGRSDRLPARPAPVPRPRNQPSATSQPARAPSQTLPPDHRITAAQLAARRVRSAALGR